MPSFFNLYLYHVLRHLRLTRLVLFLFFVSDRYLTYVDFYSLQSQGEISWNLPSFFVWRNIFCFYFYSDLTSGGKY